MIVLTPSEAQAWHNAVYAQPLRIYLVLGSCVVAGVFLFIIASLVDAWYIDQRNRQQAGPWAAEVRRVCASETHRIIALAILVAATQAAVTRWL